VQEPTTHHNTTSHSGCSNRLWGPDRSACAFLHLFVCTRPPFPKQTWNETLVLTEKYLVSNSTHRHRNWAWCLTFQCWFVEIVCSISQFAHIIVIAGFDKQVVQQLISYSTERVVISKSSDKYRNRTYCSALRSV
jgi:hypothetical protein